MKRKISKLLVKYRLRLETINEILNYRSISDEQKIRLDMRKTEIEEFIVELEKVL